MKRVSILAVAVVVMLSACGDDARPVFTNSDRTSTTTATTDQVDLTYPDGVVSDYIDGCSPEAGEAICRCTIELFQERMSLEDFLALADTDLDSNDVVQDVIDQCRREGPGTTTTVVAGSTTTVPDFVPITEIDDVIEFTIADLEQWWATELPESFGVTYEPVTSYGPYFVSEGDVPRCGGPLQRDEYEFNAFYCGIDDTIQWDVEGLMAPLFQEFGDFTVALVLAHEWGHAIQARFGFDDFSNPTIVSELQADCLAGAWTGRIAAEESDLLRLEPGDLEEAMAGFLLIGDQLGTAPGGVDAHGGSFDRLSAFFDGFNDGVARCATYEEVDPEIVFIPLSPDEDPNRGGDLLYEETAPLFITALEGFWELSYPELTGEPWVPVAGAIPYSPSTGEFPACGGTTLDAGFYESNAFYCPADDFVAWDDEVLFPALYTEIGDFAIGLVLANEWGRAAQSRAGLDLDTAAAQRQVDCLAGVWTAAMVPPSNPLGIRLAAGDLEEGIAGFLQLSVIPGEDGTEGVGAFDRFEAFKDGFFDGAAACDFG